LGRWFFNFILELGAATEVAETFIEAVGEVAASSVVEAAVKELKQMSTGLARMYAMLAGKMKPDRATMLHSEFLISPTWRANYQGVRPGRSVGGYPSGCRLIGGDRDLRA
jgi:hypothetical protein